MSSPPLPSLHLGPIVKIQPHHLHRYHRLPILIQLPFRYTFSILANALVLYQSSHDDASSLTFVPLPSLENGSTCHPPNPKVVQHQVRQEQGRQDPWRKACCPELEEGRDRPQVWYVQSSAFFPLRFLTTLSETYALPPSSRTR